jgi:hypothetical protein
MRWGRKAPPASKIVKKAQSRFARLPDAQIMDWCEMAVSDAGYSLRRDLEAAETAAVVLLTGIQELQGRRAPR